ncbi:MAG: amino acid ABC transporter permease [Alphaproteobacteria bacterium]|nr:amino acid ABC transporter permease [Alphaproteobacteria bacterium]
MDYVFQFGVVAENLPLLLRGVRTTCILTGLAIVLGTALGVLCAYLQAAGWRVVRTVVRGYVEFIRNTPFLIQIFFIAFSVPDLVFTGGQLLGTRLVLRIEPMTAAVIGMTISLGGYATEIVRGGIDAVSRGQIEAGRALGLSGMRIFRLIVLPQAVRIAYPSLASQYVLLMLGSSVVSAIAVEELTGLMNTLRSTTFRDFEFVFAVTLLYLAMSLAFRAALAGVYWIAFLRGRPAEAAAR